MADRMYNVAEMLKDCYHLRTVASSDKEREFWNREIYKWKNELMANNINPDSIDSFEFQVRHGAFSKYPALEQEGLKIINSL